MEWGKGVSNNEINCSSLSMGRTGGGACELFTSLLFRKIRVVMYIGAALSERDLFSFLPFNYKYTLLAWSVCFPITDHLKFL